MVAMSSGFIWCVRKAETLSNAYQACKANIEAAFRSIPVALQAIRGVANTGSTPSRTEIVVAAGSMVWGAVVHVTLDSESTWFSKGVLVVALVVLPIILKKKLVPRRMEGEIVPVWEIGAMTSLMPAVEEFSESLILSAVNALGRIPPNLSPAIIPFAMYGSVCWAQSSHGGKWEPILPMCGYRAGKAIAGFPGAFVGGLSGFVVAGVVEGFRLRPAQLQKIRRAFLHLRYIAPLNRSYAGQRSEVCKLLERYLPVYPKKNSVAQIVVDYTGFPLREEHPMRPSI